ncbi:hemicentin-1-like [Mytilus californianus]|uniref:hemicentin-1-like n=1 Tax=Mytilus californianus TaxID=6549 RepID=UPI002247F7F6|nr:hemicentin-1-like [Mytilus californianus]
MFGESYTIHCKVQAVPEHTDIYWQHITEGFIRTIRKDTLGVSGVTLDDPRLTINYVTTSDAGSYTCSAENVVGTGSSKSTILNVDGDIPVVDVSLPSSSVKDGHGVTLGCSVSSKPPHTNVYWIKDSDNGKLVFNHGTTGTIGMTIENPSLTLKPATITDSGTYTCLASNVIGTGASRPVSLTVMPEDEADEIMIIQGSNNPHWPTIVGAIVGSFCTMIGIIVATVCLYKCCGIGSTASPETRPENHPSPGADNTITNETHSNSNDTPRHPGQVQLDESNSSTS